MALHIPRSIFHLARLLYDRPESFGRYRVHSSYLNSHVGAVKSKTSRRVGHIRRAGIPSCTSFLCMSPTSPSYEPFSVGKPWELVVCRDSLKYQRPDLIHLSRHVNIMWKWSTTLPVGGWLDRFVLSYLRFPLIICEFFNKSQQDAILLNFILVKNSTCWAG